MLIKIFRCTLLIMVLLMSSSGVYAAQLMPNTTAAMQQAEFWTKKSGMHDIVLSAQQITMFNQRLIGIGKIYALDSYPNKVGGAKVAAQIKALTFADDELYVNGKLMSQPLRELLLTARNLEAIPTEVTPGYGVVVRRSNMRTFPTSTGAFETVGDVHFDMFQETAVDPGEPVIILHESKNKAFLFVQIYNYRGWIAKTDIAVTKDKQKWLKYVNPQEFLVVTVSLLNVSVGAEQVTLQMGAKVPLVKQDFGAEFSVYIPTRGVMGELVDKQVKINNDSSVQYGYVPYTRANILMQSFAMLGDRYGWGGLDSSVDCSSFITNIYRSVGLNLPRNADEQENVNAVTVTFNGNKADALQMFKTLQPGTAIFKEGHVMMYLGEYNGKPYIIHSFSSYADTTGARKNVMQVVVSDTNLRMRSGPLLIETLRRAVDYR